MAHANHICEFLLGSAVRAAPDGVWHAAKRSLLDLIGVAAAGITTECSTICRDAAVRHWPAGSDGATLIFDGRQANPSGASFAGGQTIDSIDAHDGFKPAKGHAGVAVLPALLAVMEATGDRLDDRQFLDCFVIGYEVACRVSIVQHRTCPDYHASGSWNSLGAAAVACRLLELDPTATIEALGIAEYYGPRSQIMRVVDTPSMVKDASGWGAMTGVTSAYLAAAGLTGSPALTLEGPEWDDLGARWRMTEQYLKLWPVCRWAQPTVQAALEVAAEHRITPTDVESVTVHTFHEARRLAGHEPTTTDEAQYSIAFPAACAFVRGRVGVDEIAGSGLRDPAILSLAKRIQLVEAPEFNAVFPSHRRARLSVRLRGGAVLESRVTEPPGDPESPLGDDQIREKYFGLAAPVLGEARAKALDRAIGDLREPGFDLPTLLRGLRSAVGSR